MTFSTDKEIGLIFMEHDAMQAAVDAAERRRDPAVVRAIIQQVYVSWKADSFESKMVLNAMAKIIGEQAIILPAPVENPWKQRCFETICHAWSAWAAHPLTHEASDMISKLRNEQVSREALEGSDRQRRDNAIHIMSLHFWVEAIERLTQGKHTEARRLWKHAIQLSHGTSSHPALIWTYAASFF